MEVLLLLPCAHQPHLITYRTWGYTLLHHAAQCGWPDLCRILVEQYQCRADDSDDDGHSVLHVACQFGHVSVVQYLLTLESVLATVSDRDRSGLTSMEWVTENRYKIYSQFASHIDLKMDLLVNAFFKLFMARK